jgi:fructose-1,6-bisphosphatase
VLRFPTLYIIKDNQTALDAATFNPRFQDLDLRLHELETQKATVEQTIDELQRFGLERINQTLGPVLETVDDKVAEAQAVLDGASGAVDDFNDDAAAALTAQTTALNAMLADADDEILWATRTPSGFTVSYDPLTGEVTGGAGVIGGDAFTIALTRVGGELTAVQSGWRGKSGALAIGYENDPTFGRRVKTFTHTGDLG